MDQGAAKDLGLGKLAKTELQPDGKEEEEDAKVGDVGQDLTAFVGQAEGGADGMDRESGREEAHQRRQAHPTDGEAEGESEAEGDDFEHEGPG